MSEIHYPFPCWDCDHKKVTSDHAPALRGCELGINIDTLPTSRTENVVDVEFRTHCGKQQYPARRR